MTTVVKVVDGPAVRTLGDYTIRIVLKGSIWIMFLGLVGIML